MIEFNIEQDTTEWHSFRANGIGASDAGTILGLNPYNGIMDLWASKTGATEISTSTYGLEAMIHGKLTEPLAREVLSQAIGINFNPACAAHSNHNWLRASLDGISEDKKYLLEIKCPSKPSSYQKHVIGVLSYYYAQAQQQLLVTGADKLYFGSYYDEKYVVHQIMPDFDLQEELIVRGSLFWDCVINKTPPDSAKFSKYKLTNNEVRFFLERT